MRVTKLIREYVEKSVKAVYEPKIDEVGRDYEARKSAIEEEIKAFVEKADAEVKQMIADAGFEVRYCRNSHYLSTYGEICIKELEDEIYARTHELHKECRAKINDILLNLELGATRAELDEMIKNLV